MNASKALSQNTYLLELRRVGAPVGDCNDIFEESVLRICLQYQSPWPTGWNFVCCFYLGIVTNIICVDFGNFKPWKTWASLAHTGRVTILMGLSTLNLYHFLPWSH